MGHCLLVEVGGLSAVFGAVLLLPEAPLLRKGVDGSKDQLIGHGETLYCSFKVFLFGFGLFFLKGRLNTVF